MQQVVKLDDSYHYFGAYIFFAVYYASQPSYLGGNENLAKKYFKRARSLNQSRLLIIVFLQAKYLKERTNKAIYIQQLRKIINAPRGMYPEQTLMNEVARQKALKLLATSRVNDSSDL